MTQHRSSDLLTDTRKQLIALFHQPFGNANLIKHHVCEQITALLEHRLTLTHEFPLNPVF
jgi:hypothetical protein